MAVSAAARAQVALEGAISKRAAMNSLAQGNLPQVPPVHGPCVAWGCCLSLTPSDSAFEVLWGPSNVVMLLHLEAVPSLAGKCKNVQLSA